MQKNILVLYYTQTGQLEDILKNVMQPLEEDLQNYVVTYYRIGMKKDFPFPWPSDVFFDAFPESYLQIPNEILPPPAEVLNKKFDLIIFGYQVWYLTPSIPIVSFLKSPFAEKIMRNLPVITISATRNMWMLSQEKLKVYFKQFGNNLVGNIALVDRHDNYTSVLTILRWITTGKKEKFGMLPAAGVSDEEIQGAGKFGKIIKKHADQNTMAQLQPELVQNAAVEIRPFLVRVEKVGNKIFTVWSRLIINNPERRPILVKMFKMYLMAAIWIVSPVVLVFHNLLAPVLARKRQKQREYLQGITIN